VSFADILKNGDAEVAKQPAQTKNAPTGDGAGKIKPLPNLNQKQLLSVPDEKLQKLSDAMFKADANNVVQYITVNYKPHSNLVDE